MFMRSQWLLYFIVKTQNISIFEKKKSIRLLCFKEKPICSNDSRENSQTRLLGYHTVCTKLHVPDFTSKSKIKVREDKKLPHYCRGHGVR